MVSGDVSCTPSVIDGTCCNGLPSARSMPIFWAIFTAGQIPISLISCTK